MSGLSWGLARIRGMGHSSRNASLKTRECSAVHCRRGMEWVPRPSPVRVTLMAGNCCSKAAVVESSTRPSCDMCLVGHRESLERRPP